MSQQNSDPTVYDGLMFVSLAAVIIGIIFLVLTLAATVAWSGPAGAQDTKGAADALVRHHSLRATCSLVYGR